MIHSWLPCPLYFCSVGNVCKLLKLFPLKGCTFALLNKMLSERNSCTFVFESADGFEIMILRV